MKNPPLEVRKCILIRPQCARNMALLTAF
ncbi:hypothetical protein LCGC14_3141530, partial [marine sediment metagenome]